MRSLIHHVLQVSLQVGKDVAYGVHAGHAVKHGMQPPPRRTALPGAAAPRRHRERALAAAPKLTVGRVTP